MVESLTGNIAAAFDLYHRLSGFSNGKGKEGASTGKSTTTSCELITLGYPPGLLHSQKTQTLEYSTPRLPVTVRGYDEASLETRRRQANW